MAVSLVNNMTEIPLTMYLKAIVLVAALSSAEGCKLFCLDCPIPPPDQLSKYYCCMEDWDATPNFKRCPDVPSSNGTNAATPCPPIIPNPSRCPSVGNPSELECDMYRRIHPNPTPCVSSGDCRKQFDSCCEDKCYGMKICKSSFDRIPGP